MNANPVRTAMETYLGNYRALRLLGEGGMGQVYLGKDLKTGGDVVIKVMHEHLAADPAVRANFQRELLCTMQFEHPYAVKLLAGSLEGPGRPCLVMEYVDGIDLDKFQEQEGRFPADRIGLWLGQLCQVLHIAHHNQILHHDLTPANLMLRDIDKDHESIKVMDFGLASLMNAYFIPMEKLHNEQTHSIGGGTPDYMSPEQIRGEQIDHRSDLYSVGVMLYKFFTGRLPFQEATEVADILLAHVNQRPPSFAEVGVDDISPKLEKVVFRLLTKFPHERLRSAQELAMEFAAAIGEPIVPKGTFEQPVPEFKVKAHRFHADDVLDSFEAWMPEAVAVMKLKAFVESIRGLIVASEPGRIRLRIVDPRQAEQAPEPKKGLFGSWGQSKTTHAIKMLNLELYMEKREVGTRSMVEIHLVTPVGAKSAYKSLQQKLCRDLRAYMMIGR